MSGRLLVGPFLTRSEAAELGGLETNDVPFRPDLLRIGGRWLPEAYCRFQFGPAGIRRDIAPVVLAMRGEFDDLTIADWLVSSNPELRGASPLAYLDLTGAPGPVLEALVRHPPQPEETVRPEVGREAGPALRREPTERPQPRLRRYPIRRPAASH